MRYAGCICLVCALLASGCRNKWQTEPMNDPPGTVTHVVLIWLKDPQDAAGKQRIIEATRTFSRIPGVRRVAVGTAVPGTQPVVDSTFDVGVAVTFSDRIALEGYGPHPIHQKAVKEVLQPLMKLVRVYDVESR